MTVDNPNVPVAFALVIGAGFATAVGAAVVFFPSLVKLASRRVLASGLGISAGVMLYVSFTELFSNSRQAFLNSGESASTAYMYTTLSFFGGVGVMIVSNLTLALKTMINAFTSHPFHFLAAPRFGGAFTGWKRAQTRPPRSPQRARES